MSLKFDNYLTNSVRKINTESGSVAIFILMKNYIVGLTKNNERISFVCTVMGDSRICGTEKIWL